ncbi:hypothetical protein Droror1_Dr00009905 [Drosera rotundifolia]
MEESEKRRQRLLAMRMEADKVAASWNVETQGGINQSGASRNNEAQEGPGSNLGNPLLETSEVQGFCTTPRFDFYTDPLAAFSSNRQRSTANAQNTRGPFLPNVSGSSPSTMMQFQSSGPNNLEVASTQFNHHHGNVISSERTHRNDEPYSDPRMIPHGIHQPWNSNSSSLTMYQDGQPYCNPLVKNPDFSPHMQNTQNNHWSNQQMHPAGPRSPYPMMSTFPVEQGAPVTMNEASPGYNWRGSPNTPYQGRGQHFTNSPGHGPGGRGSPHFSGGGYGQWSGTHGGSSSGYNGGRGRGSPHFGGGNGRWSGTSGSPGSGRGGGRGRGSHVGGSDGGFYQKSMVEDPWQSLKPVKWREQNNSKMPARFRNPQPVQESHSVKKPRVSEAFDNSGSKKSLADYLAEAFDEAVEETVAE